MPIYTDPADNLIAQITNAGRSLCVRAPIEGLAFQFYGWALGRGGYDPTNPVHVLPINSADTALIDQVYPAVSNYNLFALTDFENPTTRTVSCACRIFLGNILANYGIGEIGIWVKILNSPVNPLENGTLVLFSITHTPIQTITPNSARVYRIIHNF